MISTESPPPAVPEEMSLLRLLAMLPRDENPKVPERQCNGHRMTDEQFWETYTNFDTDAIRRNTVRSSKILVGDCEIAGVPTKFWLDMTSQDIFGGYGKQDIHHVRPFS